MVCEVYFFGKQLIKTLKKGFILKFKVTLPMYFDISHKIVSFSHFHTYFSVLTRPRTRTRNTIPAQTRV